MKKISYFFFDVYLVQMDNELIRVIKGSADAVLDCMRQYIEIYTEVASIDFKLPQFNDNDGLAFIDYINTTHPLGLSIYNKMLWEEVNK